MAARCVLRASSQKLRSLTALVDRQIGASSQLVSPPPNWSALIERGPGHYCRNFSTRAFDVKSGCSVHGRHMQDQVGSKVGSKAVIPSKVRKDDKEIDQNKSDIVPVSNQRLGSNISTTEKRKFLINTNKSDIVPVSNQRLGTNISTTEKRKFLINTLMDLKDSKEAVYGTLDSWVAWEQNFPLVSLKRALLFLEKEQQWHRVVQTVKWMLSKGQGTTVGTYAQLIRALEKDNRAEEAHRVWVKKMGHDLHSVPWRVCDLMISIYYRNNMLERLVKLFMGLESYDRVPPSKSIVQKVADAYEMLGSLEETNRIMEKYSDLFNKPSERLKKSRKASRNNGKITGTKTDKNLEALDEGAVVSGPPIHEFDVSQPILTSE